jgi:hypothetical protein
VLPENEAAGAVLDTFLVAAAKLDGLRHPDRLGSWLLAVARNECRRRMDPGQAAAAAGAADPGGGPPAELPPPGLRSRVVAACTDNSPAGRAHRVSVAHRAGAFGPAGFPKPAGPPGPRWRRDVRRPGVAAAVAVGVALALTAGITVMLTAGGSGSRPQAAGPGLAAAGPGPASGPTSSPASSAAPGRMSPTPSPARTAPGSAQPTPLATVPVAATRQATPGPPPTPGPPATSPSPSQTPSPSPSPWPSTPARGILLVKPDSLQLTSKSGQPVSGSFTITAVGGPVAPFTIRVNTMAANVKVAPARGSLPTGASVRVTVTVTSKGALTTHLTVMPGSLTITVVYKVKA